MPKLNTLPKLLACTALASTFALTACDKGDKKADDKKTADKAEEKTDDKKTDDKAEEPEAEAPKGPVFTAKGVMGDDVSLPLVAFDLAEVELPGYTITVPEGTTAESKSPSGYKLLNSQVNYSITVSEGELDKKQTLEIFEIVDPDGKVADEADDHLIYERSKDGGFLFQAQATVGDKTFTCGTVASISPFTRRVIDQAIETCKSIAAAEGGDAAAAEGGDAAAAEGDAAAAEGDAAEPAAQ